ncbi:DHA2 family efflux MFS transporter permease subunit [Roseiarcus sp.]|uniref:DHA2 family efflux MFS transporter permease subunit n=1 Tax=Roseiarcus sp. TaxID=1969460 RepID=UPI003C42DC24
MFEPAPAQFFVRRPSYPWFVVGTVCIGTFIGQVDGSIVQLALPSLEDAFGAPLDAVSWVALGYMLAFASVLSVFARLAEIAGRKTLYLAGFALFGLWSALCGLAPTLPVLIGFRILQGMSGALLGANSVVILVAAAGPERRGKALGIMAAAQAVGLSIGPALGGVLLGTLGWRWIFWVTVPFAVLGTALGWLIVPRTKAFAGDRRFDAPGAFLLVPALATLLLAISEAHAWGLSTPLIACAVGSPLLLGGFIWRESRAPAPLVNLSLFRSAAFSAGSVGVLVSYAMLYGMFFAMSFALVRGYHDQPLAAGLRLTIVPVALGLVAPNSGALSDKRPRLLMLVGMALCAASALAMARLLDGTPGSLTGVMAGLAAFGAGLGFYIAPNNNATMSAAPADKSGVAGGLLNLLRISGGAVGVAASSAVLAWGLETTTGMHERTAGAPEAALLAAVGDVLVLLAVFGALGGAMAIIRNDPKADARKAAAAPSGALKPS